MGRLDGKITIVTGAGSGIGRGVARRFAAEGAVVLVNDLRPEAADETVALITTTGGSAQSRCGDITDSSFVDDLVAGAAAAFGRLDVMHNNAGAGFTDALLTDTSDEDWNRTLALNLSGPFYGMRAALRVMAAQGSGAIITTASLSGIGGTARSAAYSAAKAAVIHLTKNAAVEFAHTGVRINAIAPGTMHTPAFEQWMSGNSRLTLAEWAAEIPQGRLGQPDDIAGAAVFLASDDAGFVNGTTLIVDGGVTAKLGGPHPD